MSAKERKIEGFHVEMWDIDRPIDYPKNARKWSPKAVEKVATSIREFGWRQPVVVDSQGVIVIGHLRRAAGKSIGLTECPVHVAADLSPAKIRALRLADNRTAQEAEWDLDILASEFADLKTFDFDLTITGFDPREIDKFTLSVNPAEDDVPPVPEVPITKPGDLWVMGGHRLLCGDATKAEDVARLLGEDKPFLMVTDPPYGVEYDPKWRKGAHRTDYMESSTDTERAWLGAWQHFPGAVAYIWHSNRQRVQLQMAMESLGFEMRCELIWFKTVWPMGRGNWKYRHEPCLYLVRKGQRAKWNDNATDAYDDTTVLEARPPGAGFGRTKDADEKESGITEHACQKPLACFEKPILRHGEKSDSVYEPFGGSGTAFIACEKLKRNCYGIELSPAYCDVIVTRWQNLTGKKAVLSAD